MSVGVRGEDLEPGREDVRYVSCSFNLGVYLGEEGLSLR